MSLCFTTSLLRASAESSGRRLIPLHDALQRAYALGVLEQRRTDLHPGNTASSSGPIRSCNPVFSAAHLRRPVEGEECRLSPKQRNDFIDAHTSRHQHVGVAPMSVNVCHIAGVVTEMHLHGTTKSFSTTDISLSNEDALLQVVRTDLEKPPRLGMWLNVYESEVKGLVPLAVLCPISVEVMRACVVATLTEPIDDAVVEESFFKWVSAKFCGATMILSGRLQMERRTSPESEEVMVTPMLWLPRDELLASCHILENAPHQSPLHASE